MAMKKIIILIVSFFLLVAGCSSKNVVNSKIKVAATIFPLYDAISEIGKDKVDAVLIIPPASDPHNFSITPQDIKKLQGVKLIFENDINLENWMDDLLQNLKGAKLINTSEAIMDNVENDNPHVWLNPDYFIAQCAAIKESLSEADPVNSSYYEANFKTYTETIESEAMKLRMEISALQVKKIVSFHDAFPYLAKYFGLQIAGSLEETPGASPTPQKIKEIEDIITQNHIKAAFKEPQQSTDIMNAIVEDTHIKVYVLDPIGGTNSRNSYLQTMQYNINTIIEALR
jgi:zinc transport system substrate-binding protein